VLWSRPSPPVLNVVVGIRAIVATNHTVIAVTHTVTATAVVADVDQNQLAHAHADQKPQLQFRLHVPAEASQSVSPHGPVSHAARSEHAARDVRLLRL